MKVLPASILALVLATTLLSARAADWYAPQDPFPLYGNSYYVGTGGISAVLITSEAGHILVGVGGPEAPAQIAAHIRKLGFKVEDIRYILSSHEHFDHAGAISALQKMSGATVLASPEAVKVLSSGQPDKRDPQLPNLAEMEPIARTRAIHDGETIKVGPIAVTAHFTPGHTKGSTSWTWASTENGKTVNIVYADSLTAVAADKFSFGRNPLYPDAKADIEHSIATVEALPCDLLVSAHPEFSHLFERKDKQPALGNEAFIDKNACRAYGADARVWLAKQLASEQ